MSALAGSGCHAHRGDDGRPPLQGFALALVFRPRGKVHKFSAHFPPRPFATAEHSFYLLDKFLLLTLLQLFGDHEKLCWFLSRFSPFPIYVFLFLFSFLKAFVVFIWLNWVLLRPWVFVSPVVVEVVVVVYSLETILSVCCICFWQFCMFFFCFPIFYCDNFVCRSHLNSQILFWNVFRWFETSQM